MKHSKSSKKRDVPRAQNNPEHTPGEKPRKYRCIRHGGFYRFKNQKQLTHCPVSGCDLRVTRVE